MGQVRREILAFDDFAACGSERGQGVTLFSRNGNFGLREALFEVLHQRRRGQLGVLLRHIPLDADILQGLFGPPPVVRHHRHKIPHIEDFFDTAAIVNFAAVQGLDLAIENGARRHRSVHHTRQLGIDAIADFGAHDVGNLTTLDGLANDLPILGVLQRHIGWRIELRSSQSQFAIGHALLTGGVVDHPELGHTLGGWHTHGIGTGHDEHLACCGTGFPQILMRVLDRARTHRGHVAINALLRQIGLRRGVLDRHFFPIGFQFIGHQHGGRGARALTHFCTGVANDDALIGLNFNPSVDLLGRVGGCGGGRLCARQYKAKREPQT